MKVLVRIADNATFCNWVKLSHFLYYWLPVQQHKKLACFHIHLSIIVWDKSKQATSLSVWYLRPWFDRTHMQYCYASRQEKCALSTCSASSKCLLMNKLRWLTHYWHIRSLLIRMTCTDDNKCGYIHREVQSILLIEGWNNDKLKGSSCPSCFELCLSVTAANWLVTQESHGRQLHQKRTNLMMSFGCFQLLLWTNHPTTKHYNYSDW